ncbi:unnamed protein product [Aspergillus oryzae RIB40]|uniref:DNA, SC012 n=1 Tax=Aspergillus oryzae (strain ATCC 42149 / RIB 40) TaxID=510516 RepID=Q2UCN5_ASPOR|nr:unnamed protein product [Aspergillus oryzae RIB40]BAE60680.1 unnamed protein product [Aspergillus oryzae RIB40]
MDLSRQEYPALLASLQPGQATSVLNDRIRLINKINADIADWLQSGDVSWSELILIRATGATPRRRSIRPRVTETCDAAATGQWSGTRIPWQRIVNATEMVASSHETFAQKIEEDVERPLRDYHTKNRELASLPGVQSDLATLAKNLEASLKKVEKAREKGPKGADKLAGAVAASEGVRQEWESRAPFAFEQLQAADESRLNHLRDALTQLETHESDQVERCRQAAETCLNVLLNVETADEIKTFAEKVNGGRPVVLRQQVSPTPAAAPSGPPPRLHDDTASQRSETSGPVRTPPAPEPQPRHTTPLGGLKRLGTVMNRRKSIIQPSGGAAFFSDKKHRSPFASFKRGDSREMQIPESLPDEERPGTALTTQENHNEVTRITSETNDHEGHGPMTSIPSTQPAPTTANGTTSPEPPAETSFAASDSNQMYCRPLISRSSHGSTPKDSRNHLRLLMRSLALREKQLVWRRLASI